MAKRTTAPFAGPLRVIHATALAGALAFPAAAETNTAVFMPGAFTDQQIGQDIYEGLLPSLTRPEPGRGLTLVDLDAQRTVLRVEMPDRVYPDNPGFQRRHIAPVVSGLQGYFGRAFEAGKRPREHTTVAHDTGLPYRLNELPQYAGEADRMVILTAVRSEDSRAPEMDTHQLVPSHAMLDLSTKIPFGAAGLEGTLDKVEVWVCVLDRDWPHPAQATYLRDFYALKIERMGGRLMAWTENLPECLGLAREGKAMRMPEIARDPDQDVPAFLDISQDGWTIGRVLEGYETPGADDAPAQAVAPAVDLSWMAELSGAESLSGDEIETLRDRIETGALSPITATFADYDQVDHDKLRFHIPFTGQSFDLTLTGDPQSITFLIDSSGTARLTGLDEGRGGGVTARVTAQDGTETKLQIGVGETRDIAFRP